MLKAVPICRNKDSISGAKATSLGIGDVRVCVTRTGCAEAADVSRCVIRTGKMLSFEERLIQAVKKKREAEGLSIRALATAVGVSFSTLARIERGEGQPDNNSKIRLLQWLGAYAEEAGLSFDNVAFVHFRAGRNVQSSTVRILLQAADCLRQSLGSASTVSDESDVPTNDTVALSKDELEGIAERFRADLGLGKDEPLDSLRLEVQDIHIVPLSNTACVDARAAKQLRGSASTEWSAMSVPLDIANDRWAVLLNDSHTVERQRVTVLEEYWHILLGHKLTKISKVAEAFGRTYDATEEHDAYYLASASLLPKAAVIEAVSKNLSSAQMAAKFGTSSELVEYRIKRLGMWREFTGKQVKLTPG